MGLSGSHHTPYVAGGSQQRAGSLESLAHRIGGWIAPLVFFYVMIVWPLVFGVPLPTAADESLGWLVVESKQNSVWKTVAYPALFLLAGASFLLSASYRRLPWGHPGLIVLMCTIAYAFSSVGWSADPKTSLMRAMLLLITTTTLLLAVYMARSYSHMVMRIFWVIFVCTLLNAAALVVRPPSSIGYTGIYDQKNVFGWVAAVTLYFSLYKLLTGDAKERAAALCMSIAAPVFLVASASKTSLGLAALAPVCGTVLWIAARYFSLTPAIVFPALVAIAAFVFEIGRAAGQWDLFSVNDAIFGNPTLTGRTEIWAFALSLVREQPIFGWGYEAIFGTGPDGVAARNAIGFVREMPTSHNGYVDILLQLGAVGLFLKAMLLVIILYTIGQVVRMKPAAAWLGLTIFVFVAIHNCLESDILISSNPLSMMLLLMFFMAIRLNGAHVEAARSP